MRRRTLVVIGLCLCAAIVGPTQTPVPAPPRTRAAVPAKPVPPNPGNATAGQSIWFDATALGSPVKLTQGWRVGVTADQSAATPGFDDSTWAVRDATPSIADVSDQANDLSSKNSSSELSAQDIRQAMSQRRYAWFRLHVRLAPNHGPVSLLVELPAQQTTSIAFGDSSLTPEVFANGAEITPEGPNGSNASRYQQITRIYKLNVAPQETSLTLVIRVLYIPFGYGAYTNFFSNRTLWLGPYDDLQRKFEIWNNHSLFERLPGLIYSVLLIVLSLFLFALYFAQKGHTEYLWLALHELAQAPVGFIELSGGSARMDKFWFAALILQLIVISAYFFFEFLVRFLSLPSRWYIKTLRYTAPILAGVGPALLTIGHSTLSGILLIVVALATITWMLGYGLFIFITLSSAAFKRNFEAALLLVPLILGAIGLLEPVFTAVVRDELGNDFQSPLTMYAGPIPIHFASIADYAGILVILLIIFFRFLRIQRDQERVSSELVAARSVQELLIPHEKPVTPGFEVDSVYSPANEVGGDFFHVQSLPQGILVVIGDVAGKGLKAAMNVSLLMGALRRIPEHCPAKILESLNRVVAGTDSFTTCQALLFEPSGRVVIANAGHLPPYLNSQEIAIEGSLPLGVIPEVKYDEVRFYIHPGDRVLLISDGVIEAREASGELFGFDRIRHFSQQSAYYIAEAAKSFGQQDDITVLTVRREALAAA